MAPEAYPSNNNECKFPSPLSRKRVTAILQETSDNSFHKATSPHSPIDILPHNLHPVVVKDPHLLAEAIPPKLHLRGPDVLRVTGGKGGDALIGADKSAGAGAIHADLRDGKGDICVVIAQLLDLDRNREIARPKRL